MVQNNRLVFLQEPQGIPQLDRDMQYQSVEFDVSSVPLSGGVVTKSVAISLDPTLRNSMKVSNKKPYSKLYIPGQPMWGFGVGQVVRSEHKNWKEGDLVYSPYTHMATYQVINAEELDTPNAFFPLKPHSDLNITTYLSALGMPGRTAYMSLKDIVGEIKPGETMFVTSAAGIVGQLVCQIAKQAGAKVIASAGSSSKVEFLQKTIGVDRAFNYKTADIDAELEAFGRETDGVNYLFDNVGGAQLDSWMAHSAVFGKVVVCGAISAYSSTSDSPAPAIKNFPIMVLTRQLTLRGFIVSSLMPRWEKDFQQEMPELVRQNKIRSREDVRFGVEKLASSFLDLLAGQHDGKVVVLTDDDESQRKKWLPRNPDGFAA